MVSRVPDEAVGHRLAARSLSALGVVFGDIGTSPLYALRECFHGEYGIAATPQNLLGILSLMFWALLVIVTLKYLTFILRADNHGEGGVIALMSLIPVEGFTKRASTGIFVVMGLFAASLLYGDGMITPAISVMSAIEGIRFITPVFKPYVIPITIGILTGLFLLQHRGTARVGTLFGPVVFLWLFIIGFLGFVQILADPKILVAVLPWYGFDFLLKNHLRGFVVLGAVFLVVTGAEALYADIGHFGKRPIRLAWIALVLPSLFLNYFGQGALLLSRPGEAYHPFYALVPSWGIIPMVILATAATIIASQAVITGAFSVTKQAIQLGYLPRLSIVHTSAKFMGQIYVPPVNWVLMLATIGLVAGFRSSGKLAAAYGVAVTSTMLISTILFYVVARKRWLWSRIAAGTPTVVFLLVDLSFFGANISKILHGAWFPLVVGACIFMLMTTWKRGREIVGAQVKDHMLSFEQFQKTILTDTLHRVKGHAVFLTGNPNVVPAALLHNVTHNKVLHSEIVFLHFVTDNIPRVPNDQKIEMNKLGSGFHRIIAHYGFMEFPNVSNTMSLMREKGIDFKLENTSFFLGRATLLPGKGSRMNLWRRHLFAFMSRNATDAVAYYDIPSDRVIEVGVQFEL
jgi:KUP system potassium uptake protein